MAGAGKVTKGNSLVSRSRSGRRVLPQAGRDELEAEQAPSVRRQGGPAARADGRDDLALERQAERRAELRLVDRDVAGDGHGGREGEPARVRAAAHRVRQADPPPPPGVALRPAPSGASSGVASGAGRRRASSRRRDQTARWATARIAIAATGPAPTDPRVMIAAVATAPAPAAAAGRGAGEERQDEVERGQGERGAPQLGLVVDDRARGQEVQRRPEPDRGRRCPGEGRLAPRHRPFAGDEPADTPAEARGEGERDDEGEEHGDRRQSAVEAVGDRQQREAQQGRDRAVVHVGPVALDDALDREHVRRHVPVAGEERPRLGVVEVRVQALLQKVPGAVGHHPGEGDRGERAAECAAECEPGARRRRCSFTVRHGQVR